MLVGKSSGGAGLMSSRLRNYEFAFRDLKAIGVEEGT